MKNIKVITFDADDTLWNFNAMTRRGNQAASNALIRHLGKDYRFLTSRYLAECTKRQFALEDMQKVDFLQARRTAWTNMLCEEIGLPADEAHSLMDVVMQVYVSARDERYEFFDDALLTLEALRGYYVLGYLTNGTTTPEKAQIAHYFDFVIMPETLQIRKPRPEVFHHAALMGKATPQEVLHIGDDLRSDVSGALNAGCHAVWYNPRRYEARDGIQPTAEIHSLCDLLELLVATESSDIA